MLEEAVLGAAGGHGGAPGADAEVGNGVEREREQVEADQKARQGLLAVAEVVLEVVALGLEDVEGLVLGSVETLGVPAEISPLKGTVNLRGGRVGCPGVVTVST